MTKRKGPGVLAAPRSPEKRAAGTDHTPGAELTSAAPRHEKEAAARAAVASIAMNEAGRMSNLGEKRERLELAQAQLLRSLRCLELDLERLSA